MRGAVQQLLGLLAADLSVQPGWGLPRDGDAGLLDGGREDVLSERGGKVGGGSLEGGNNLRHGSRLQGKNIYIIHLNNEQHMLQATHSHMAPATRNKLLLLGTY